MDAPRILILTASIGEGHDLPARMLADGIREERPDVHVDVVDFLDVVGKFAKRLVIDGSQFDSDWGNRLFDVEYRLIAEIAPTRKLAGAITGGLAGRPALRAVSQWRPDVVVSTYPGSTEALGRLRLKGQGRHPGRLGDHRPRIALVLGPPRHRPPPDHASRVRRRGPRSRARQPDRVRPRAHRSRLLRAARRDRGARAARPAHRGQDRHRLRRRLGRRRPERRGRGGADASGRERRLPRAAATPRFAARSRAGSAPTRGSRSSASPSRCPICSPPPTCSCTRRRA